MIRCVAVLLIVSTANIGQAQEVTPPSKMVRSFLMAEVKKASDARAASVASLKTPDDVKKRQQVQRAKLIEALGGFPEKTPLNPQVVGKQACDGYRIERVIYESRPAHHVTATLYIPDGTGPFPGVLMPIGHSNNGKAADYVQRGAILLAKNGMACLTYDPIGQGERRQLLDETGKAAIPGGTTEHTLIGVGAMLIGEGTASYRVWDGIRSLDYLASRPEIDAQRLGCTGCSGGGTLTSYLMAVDERILAAAPSCYLTTLERLFSTLGPQDAEQNIPGQLALGIDHAEYIVLRAPRPTLILAATRDFFDISGTWTTFREAKRVYALFGLSERMDMVEIDAGHGYPRAHREPMVRFMARWLLGKDATITEPDLPILKDDALRCTRTGQVLEDLKGVSCFDLTRKTAERLEAGRRGGVDREALLAEVRRLLGLPSAIAPATIEETNKQGREAITVRFRTFTTEPGIRVPSAEFLPVKPSKGRLVVLVSGDGMASVEAEAEKRTRNGERVLTLDLRGFGETAPSKAKPGKGNYFGGEYFESWVSLHLARPMLGQRTFDLLAVLAALARDNPEGYDVVGIGTAGPIVLHAAALESRIASVVIEGSILSWTDVARTPLAIGQLVNVVPGVLRSYDLPELAGTIAPRPLTVRNPTDATLTALPGEKLMALWPAARIAYEKVGAKERLRILAE